MDAGTVDRHEVIRQEREYLGSDPARWQRLGEALTDSTVPVSDALASMFSENEECAWTGHVSFFGIALSGGGIRSATFNLGVLQLLAGKGLLGIAHYLSTVSGGGYLGGCVHALNTAFARGEGRSAEDLLAQQPYHRESEAVRHLRAYSHFLAPNGFLDQLRMLLQPFAGFVANLLVLLSFILFLAGGGGVLAGFWKLLG